MNSHLVHLCNPENRRAAYLREACSSLGWSPPLEISWCDYLDGKKSLPESGWVRLESPGENDDVEKRLINLGGGPGDLDEDFGRLRHQVEWFQGWQQTMVKLQRTPARFINSPSELATMFDKWSAQKKLEAVGVPVPDLIGKVESFEQLLDLLEASNSRRAFLKPCHSSSASGVVAFQMGSRERIAATTSAEIQRDGRIYNSLRLQRYLDRETIGRLIDQLAQQNLFAESWFPKASIGGRNFDLRCLVIAGEARHIVVRTSQSPITNLHLGNARGDLEVVKAELGSQAWDAAMDIAERAALAFPGCLCVAVDLMVSSSHKRFAVAEVNAFGDLLPGVISRGDDTYTAELRALEVGNDEVAKDPNPKE